MFPKSILSAGILLSLKASATPTPEGYATANLLEGFPTLGGDGLRGTPAFMHADPDGVYRAYDVSGEVLAAVRLTSTQIETWIASRARHLSKADASIERESFGDAHPGSVPEEQLMHPPPNIKPMTLIEQFSSRTVSPRGPIQLLAARQIFPPPGTNMCPPLYCVNNPTACATGGQCLCNGNVCVIPSQFPGRRTPRGSAA